ncbi:MAG: MEDS domain-containing protein [Planctomycetota bacterium]|nr:MAG: MEDS domain-containing protein [Planctomycetota bacterium]
MEEKVRKTGIEIVGDVSWGTHFCQFYQTREDLIDILVPYFRAGLKDNEFCMWVTSEPLNVEDAKKALSQKVKGLDGYIKKGQIEILDYSRWYKKSGHFDSDNVLQAWVEKERKAIKKGFEGLRLTGNTFWLEDKDWKNFTDYEAVINSVIGKYKMLAICTYCLNKCTASEIIDVVSNHQFALIKREAKWEIIESTQYKKTVEAMQESEEKYRAIFEQAADSIVLIDAENGELVEFNERAYENLGYTREEFQGLKIPDFDVTESSEQVAKHIVKIVGKRADAFETKHRTKSGEIRDILVNSRAISIGGRDFVQSIWEDITERKRAEKALKLHDVRLQALLDLNKMIEASEQEILDFVREEAVRITKSKFAFIGFMNEDESVQTTYAWSKEVMRQCAIVETPRQFSVAEAGLWGEAVRQRRPIIINDYAAPHPQKKGCPKGHVPMKRFLCVPVFDGERIVMVAAVANKEKDYEQSDVRAITSMINDTWRLIRRKRAEEQVENMAKFPSENPNPVLRIAKDGTVLYANFAGSELLKNWSCEVGARVPEHWYLYILRILKSGLGEELETVCCKDRTFSLIIAPVVDGGYVNMYGIDVTKRKQAEEDLRKYRQHLEELVQARTEDLTEANKQLLQEIKRGKQLERTLLDVSEREQRRIGRELHDSIGQQFTGIAFMTKVLEQKLATKLPEEAANAAEIAKLINRAMEQTRGLAKGLEPVNLDAGSLTSTLQEFAVTTERLFGIHCIFKSYMPLPVDDAAVAMHLYRITQEAVTNAIKHGGAKNIHIELVHDGDKSVLRVKSDGIDFPGMQVKSKGMGLQIMNHRAEIIGGSLDIRKGDTGGTIACCTFPSRHPPSNSEKDYGSKKNTR